MDISAGSVDAGDGITAPDARETGDAGTAAATSEHAAPPSRQPASGRWVDSSWDLCRGLTVHEGLPADANLDEWLEAMLRG